MRRGFAYLIVVLDWYSRRVLSWRLSNTLTIDFCIEVVEEAMARYGRPEIFNTDQGSQFTSAEFIALLKANGIQVSMDGKGCWRDNVFVERLWFCMIIRDDATFEILDKASDCKNWAPRNSPPTEKHCAKGIWKTCRDSTRVAYGSECARTF